LIAEKLSSIDWVAAAIIAQSLCVAYPTLPEADDFDNQYNLCDVEIGVEWGYERYSISVKFHEWVDLLNGGWYSTESPYAYEGKSYEAQWTLSTEPKPSISVTYSCIENSDDDEYSDEGSGEGYKGSLFSADITGPSLFGIDVAKLFIDAFKDNRTSMPKESDQSEKYTARPSKAAGSLLQYLSSSVYICPMPEKWAELSLQLTRLAMDRALNSPPSPPLMIWNLIDDTAKADILREQIRYCDRNGFIDTIKDFLANLQHGDWLLRAEE
jgi:hypothetical protein